MRPRDQLARDIVKSAYAVASSLSWSAHARPTMNTSSVVDVSRSSAQAEAWPAMTRQKREWDARRRRRLEALHHLYRLLEGVDRTRCFYCRKSRSTTLDHFPSLLMLDGLGIEFFDKLGIPLVLIPACATCSKKAHLALPSVLRFA